MKMLLYLAIAFLFPCSFGDPPPALEGAHMEFESLEIITDNDVPCMKITCSVTHTAKESIMEFPPKAYLLLNVVDSTGKRLLPDNLMIVGKNFLQVDEEDCPDNQFHAILFFKELPPKPPNGYISAEMFHFVAVPFPLQFPEDFSGGTE